MTTFEEILSKAVPYFQYVFEILKQRYRLEIHWEIDTSPRIDRTLIGAGEKIEREIYELRIYITGKGAGRVNGITRYYILSIL